MNTVSADDNSSKDPIQVTHVDFGDAYPVFTNARVRPADDTGRMVSIYCPFIQDLALK